MTRAAHQAQELAAPLRDLGFEVIVLPAIGISPPADPEPLRRAARECDQYDWIIFSSVNAVEAFAAEVPRLPTRAKIAAMGAATREAAERNGLRVTLMPEKFVAESLLELFAAEELSAKRVLIPSAAVTRDVIPAELQRRGASVDVVEAYRNVPAIEIVEQAKLVFRDPFPDCVLFASSSAVENLTAVVGVAALRQTKIMSIGPVTSATLRKHGLEPCKEAAEHSVKGLIDACVMMQAGQ